MFKGLKWGIAGLLIGQALGLFRSKPELQDKFAQAQGVNKAKVVFDELVSFNTSLIESIDLKKLNHTIAFRIERLQNDITTLTKERATLSEEKSSERLNYLITTSETISKEVKDYVENIDEQNHLTEKLQQLKKYIVSLQEKLAKK